MKTKLRYLILIAISFLGLQSCEDNDDTPLNNELQINDFIWKGMNAYYLWQAEVPDLDDNRFPNYTQYEDYLRNFTPESLFNTLKLDESRDKFSWMVNDYTVLEQSFQGTTKSNGIEFKLSLDPNDTNKVVGIVNYIVPNSNASGKNIKRGEIFYGVNGTTLTLNNYRSLLFGSNEVYTLNFADFTNSTIVPNGKSLEFIKTTLNENPILINKVITSGARKIGYLMYNGFYSSYDTALNTAFEYLKVQGVTDLVLDLRYNPGGSVGSATRLASMITGQFTGQVFSKLTYNQKSSKYNVDYLFPDKIGTTPISSLNLTKVYILTTSGTASASELIINGLAPYIEVVQIGDTTVGKNQASVTLYDSPDFSSKNKNPNHKYAIQPIVAYTVNKNGFGDYQSGLKPTFTLKESVSTYGVLGDPSEPLLKTAISKITGITAKTSLSTTQTWKEIGDSKNLLGRGGMQIE
ncbi:S41 family peptidase [Flavobacterium sp. UMI-01]|uniref:S41 family peptidase n=1 Tax=Flavobacterium sp. UMI-01 TaxID=1441053 RepID=UPI001C7CFF94|nr:S41 family peptidase [Flavobacterium sp. UMI-01]GIZ07671.1 peptidase S41 [Flavobacterium sp. UMI-01]